MPTRCFNCISVQDGQMLKSSETNSQKIKAEYLWMKNISEIDSLKKYVPENLSFDNEVLSMKYYPQGDLGSQFLNKTSLKEVESTIKDLLNIFSDFKKVKVRGKDIDFNKMYSAKTTKRLRDNPFFGKYNYYLVNGKVINDINMPLVIDKCKELDQTYDFGVVHGDFFFSNILRSEDGYKLIDPRGSFGGEPSIYGDRRYDLAKLRHSISGGYDYIINNKYTLSYNNNIVDYKIKFNYDSQKATDYFDKQIRYMGYNTEDIKFMEGLLFLTMIPLHKESLEHQLLFYMIALEKLNCVYDYR